MAINKITLFVGLNDKDSKHQEIITPKIYDMDTTLKGRAKHTYNRVMAAMAEDNNPSMCHTFAALTQQAKNIALQIGKFANTYILGALKDMPVNEAAKELTDRAAALVSCKVRKVDYVITLAFVAEYIDRQRKAASEKQAAPESEEATQTELSHAGQCMEIYLHNTREIYDRFTVPTIARLVDMQRGDNFTMWHVMRGVIEDWDAVDDALQAAADIVRKFDGLKPTPADVEAVRANYVAFIIEAAQYELQNA